MIHSAETAIDGRLIIDGKRVEGDGAITSKNQATLEPVGEAHLASADQCRNAIAAAERAHSSGLKMSEGFSGDT